MKVKWKNIGLGAALSALSIIGLAGCGPSDPQGTPIAQRKPGEDITPEQRADKRGDLVRSAGVDVPASTPQTPGTSPVTK
jgi:hypothetical protein